MITSWQMITNEKFDEFDKESRIPLKGEDIKLRILDKLIAGTESFYQEINAKNGEKRAKPARFQAKQKAKKRKLAPR